jgi:spore coat polysaccharide biosynthesis protein SpsF
VIESAVRALPGILQARMKSSRLPGKVLMPAVGRPILSLNVERLRRARTVSTVVVATSDSPEDDAIDAMCRREDIPVFRGREEDVLDRIYQCAVEYAWPVFAKFTADNPLIDPAVIDRVNDVFLADPGRYDYVSNNHPPTWQDGQEIEVIRTAALEEAWRSASETFQREHVTPYIWDQPARFRLANVARTDDHWYHRYRWTLDYPADYDFIRTVYERLYPARPDFDTAALMAMLDAHPEIHAINAAHQGSVWYDRHLDALQTIDSRGRGEGVEQ